MSVGAKSFLIFGVGYRGGLLSNNDAAFIGVAEEYEAAKRRRPTMHKYYINFLTPRFQVIKDLNTSPDQPYRLLQYHHCCRRWPPVGDKAWAVVESRRLCDHAVVAFSKDSAASSDDANASAIRPALCTTMEFCRSWAAARPNPPKKDIQSHDMPVVRISSPKAGLLRNGPASYVALHVANFGKVFGWRMLTISPLNIPTSLSLWSLSTHST
jgi:hypothetical protein